MIRWVDQFVVCWDHLAACDCASSVTIASFNNCLPHVVRKTSQILQLENLDNSIVDTAFCWSVHSQLENDIFKWEQSFSPAIIADQDDGSIEGRVPSLILLLTCKCVSLPRWLFLITIVLFHLVILLILIVSKAFLDALQTISLANAALEKICYKVHSMALIIATSQSAINFI